MYSGESAEIQCSAKGDTPMKLTWSFQGQLTNGMKGIEIMKTSATSSLLRIEELTSENSGNYTVENI